MSQREKTITRASKEWFSRPDDERYLTWDDLYQATFRRGHASRVFVCDNRIVWVRGR